MIPQIVIELLKNKWTWVVLVIAGLAIFGYVQYKQVQELTVQKDILRQNELALRDSVSKLADSIQTTTSYVRDLNTKNDKLKSQYRALETRYSLAIDSIHILKDGIAQMLNDSVAVIPHVGKKSIATYSGKTEFNIRSRNYKTTLDIAFDVIGAKAEVLYDEKESLWKLKTTSLTPGVDIIGYSVIDEETLRKLRGVEKPDPPTYRLGIGALFTQTQFSIGVLLRPANWSIGIGYKIFDKLAESDELWMNKLVFSIYYHPF